MDTPHAPRARRADARRNNQHILATARAAFTEMGPDAPLDLIARRAGVGSATLYRHFPTREHLLEAAYRSDIADLTRRAVELAEYFEPLPALERWVLDYFVPALEERGVAAMLKDALVSSPEVFEEAKKQFSEAVGSLVRVGQESGTVRDDIAPPDILAMAHGIAVNARTAAARKRMLTVMFDGLRPPIDASRPGEGPRVEN